VKIPFRHSIVAGALALASVTPAMAAPGNGHGQSGDHGQQGQSHGKANGKAKVHNVTYVFKGTWSAASGLSVKSGNAHVRKAGLIGQDVQFDLSGARLVVADTDGVPGLSSADVKDGDRVVIKARLPRKDQGTQPFAARMLVDQSNPAAPAPESD
jgi:hypothetical protein